MSKTTTTTGRADVYASVTAGIVEQLEKGVRPWHQPWTARHPAGSVSRPLRNTGQPYQGVNVLVLWLTAFEKGYSCPLWLTFNQAKDLGGSVKKGEKGTTVVYASTFEKTGADETTGEETKERIPFLKAYTVFNAEQVEGLPARYSALAESPHNLAERLAHAEAFFANTKARTEHGGNWAFYSPFLTDPAGDFLDLLAAVHDRDFDTAGDLAARLQAALAAPSPDFGAFSRGEVEAYVASVLRRPARPAP